MQVLGCQVHWTLAGDPRSDRQWPGDRGGLEPRALSKRACRPDRRLSRPPSAAGCRPPASSVPEASSSLAVLRVTPMHRQSAQSRASQSARPDRLAAAQWTTKWLAAGGLIGRIQSGGLEYPVGRARSRSPRTSRFFPLLRRLGRCRGYRCVLRPKAAPHSLCRSTPPLAALGLVRSGRSAAAHCRGTVAPR